MDCLGMAVAGRSVVFPGESRGAAPGLALCRCHLLTIQRVKFKTKQGISAFLFLTLPGPA